MVSITPKTRKCRECGERKKIEDFKKAKTDYTTICKSCINKNRSKNKDNIKHDKYYIYRFYDKKNNVIYVGQTRDMNTRMSGHLYNSKSDCTGLYEKLYWIEYADVKSDYHMNIYEMHYICRHKPKFNIQFASENIDLFDLPKVKWKPYITNDYMRRYCTYHSIRNNNDITQQEVVNKLESNITFSNQFTKEYRNSNHIHRQFNAHLYEYC